MQEACKNICSGELRCCDKSRHFDQWLESSGTGSEIVADIFCSRLRQYYTCVGVSMGIIDLRTEMGEAGSQSL